MDMSEFADPGLIEIVKQLQAARRDLQEANRMPLNTSPAAEWDDKTEGTGPYSPGCDCIVDPNQPSENRSRA